MHLHDDDVSYTRIIEPDTAGDDLAPPPPGEVPALVWRPRLGDDQSYPLEGRMTRLGRHDENDIVLAGPTVSARHATVRIEPIGVVLEDEGSLNGTFVNGERIEQRLLEEGDRIQIGPHLLLFVPAATP
jgi:sulfur carrier protein ThiS